MKSVVHIALMLLLVAHQATSASERFYYSIGGGQLSDASSLNWRTFDAKLDLYAGVQYSCGDFDLKTNLKDIGEKLKSDAEDKLDEFVNFVIVSGVNIASALPALALQKASPGLYEFLNNAFLRYKDVLQVKLATCKRVEALAAGGELNQLADFAKLVQWRKSIESGTGVKEAAEEVRETSVTGGIPWVDGAYRGGEDQEPIKLVADVIQQGYTHTEKEETTTSTDPTTAEKNSAPKPYFTTAEQATDWAVGVLGEKTISLVGDNQSSAGSGLAPEIAELTQQIEAKLNTLVQDPTEAKEQDIVFISTPNYRINRAALAAINARSGPEQKVLKARLASELATLQTIEKAYLIRDFVHSGMQESNIYYSPLKDSYLRLIEQIDNEIANARTKAALRKELVGELLVKTFETAAASEQRGARVPTPKPKRLQHPGGGVLR